MHVGTYPHDAENGTVSPRDQIDGDLGAMTVAEAITKLKEEVRTRPVRQTFDNAAPVAAAESGEGDGY